MDVTLPNGQVIQGVPDGTTKAQLAQKLTANGFKVPPEWMGTPKAAPESTLATVGNRALGGLEGVGNTVINAGSAVAQGLAGLGAGTYGGIKNRLSDNPIDQGTAATNAADNAMDFVRQHTPQMNFGGQSVQEGNQASQQALGTIAGLPQMAVDKSFDLTGKVVNAIPGASQFINSHPGIIKATAGLQSVGDIAANALPMMLGPKGKPSAPIAKAAPAAFEDNPVLAAHQAGYVLPPSEAGLRGANVLGGKVVEGLSGSAKLRTSADIRAQANTNRLGNADLGLAPTAKVNEGVLDQIRAPENAVYKEVEDFTKPRGNIQPDSQYYQDLQGLAKEYSSSFGDNPDIMDALKRAQNPSFTSSELLREIKTLRGNAKANYRGAENPSGAGKNTYTLGDLADVQQGIADALESQLGRFVKNWPDSGDLLDRFQAARKKLAIINTYDNALKPGSSDFSAPLLARQFNKAPQKFSGNMPTIAKMYNTFPRIMSDPAKLANKVPVNMLETGIGGMGTMAALYAHNPALAAGGVGLMFARPAVRAGLLGDSYQKALAGVPKTPINPLLRSLIDPAVLQALQTGNK